jgi:hypothetical protein
MQLQAESCRGGGVVVLAVLLLLPHEAALRCTSEQPTRKEDNHA